ncbi:hypothetical protein CMUS01_06447 [Colletotrichum musicola]|uniref:F-box domain-containing protein n=1 Tax=Colletotrichum musicola TaxID=2175873 RepID=A0A8H6KM53_9PEZI|nr:hypothetical protein CMUS01_06447 [Colletotrichum musicola]
MDKLPVEMLDNVLGHLPVRAKLRLRRTCRVFNDILLKKVYEKLRRIQDLCGKKLPFGYVYPARHVAAFGKLVAKAGLSENDAPLSNNDCVIAYGYHDHRPFPANAVRMGRSPMSCFMHLCLFEMHREERRLHLCRRRGEVAYIDGLYLPDDSSPSSLAKAVQKRCLICGTEYYVLPPKTSYSRFNPRHRMLVWWSTLENEFGEYIPGRRTMAQ